MIKSIGSKLNLVSEGKSSDVFSVYKTIQKISAKKSTLELKKDNIQGKIVEIDTELDAVKSSLVNILCNTVYLRGDSVIDIMREVIRNAHVPEDKVRPLEELVFKEIKKSILPSNKLDNLTPMWGSITSDDGLLLYPDEQTCVENGVHNPVKVLVDLSAGVINE
jgi:hypothetical protein